MFSLLFPTFYAWSVHGIWIGLLVFIIMLILIILVNWWWPSLPRNKHFSYDQIESKTENYRTIIAIVMMIIIALTTAQACRMDSKEGSQCVPLLNHQGGQK